MNTITSTITPRITTRVEKGRVDNSLPCWHFECRTAYAGGVEHYHEGVVNVTPYGFDMRVRITRMSLAFKRGMRSLKISGYKETYPEIPLSQEDLEKVLNWVARHPEADVAFASRPHPHYGGYEWQAVPPPDEAKRILRELRANENALRKAGVVFTREGFAYGHLLGWRGVLRAGGHCLEFRGYSSKPSPTVESLCRRASALS